MTPEQWLTLLSLACTAALGIYTVHKSRQSTRESSEVALRGQDLERLKAAEAKAERAEQHAMAIEDYNRRMWLWARRHVDLYYRYRKPDAPDPEPIPDPPEAA